MRISQHAVREQVGTVGGSPGGTLHRLVYLVLVAQVRESARIDQLEGSLGFERCHVRHAGRKPGPERPRHPLEGGAGSLVREPAAAHIGGDIVEYDAERPDSFRETPEERKQRSLRQIQGVAFPEDQRGGAAVEPEAGEAPDHVLLQVVARHRRTRRDPVFRQHGMLVAEHLRLVHLIEGHARRGVQVRAHVHAGAQRDDLPDSVFDGALQPPVEVPGAVPDRGLDRRIGGAQGIRHAPALLVDEPARVRVAEQGVRALRFLRPHARVHR